MKLLINMIKMEKPNHGWFDIDKTLITGDNRPEDHVLKAISKVPNRGVNTQRSLGQTEKVIASGEVNLPCIIHAGGEVWNLGGEMIKSFPINIETRKLLAKLILENKDSIDLARFYPEGDRKVWIYVANDELEEKFSKLYLPTNSFGKLTRSIDEYLEWFVNTSTTNTTIRTKEKTILPISSELADAVEFDNSAKNDYFITAKGVKKVTTLLWLCEYLGLDPKDVLTAGDSLATDSEVFKHTIGISVGPELLPHAKMSAQSIDELVVLLDNIYNAND